MGGAGKRGLGRLGPVAGGGGGGGDSRGRDGGKGEPRLHFCFSREPSLLYRQGRAAQTLTINPYPL